MDIKNKIYQMIMEKSKVTKEMCALSEEDDLVYDLGLDSLSLVELIVDIETEYGIEIEENDMDQIYKFGSLVNYITARTKER